MKVARYFHNFSRCRCTGNLAVAIYGIYVGTRIYIDKQIHAGMCKPILHVWVCGFVCVCMTRYPLLDSAAHDIRKRRTKQIGKLMKVKASVAYRAMQSQSHTGARAATDIDSNASTDTDAVTDTAADWDADTNWDTDAQIHIQMHSQDTNACVL